MLKLKSNVHLGNAQMMLPIMIMVVQSIYDEWGLDCTITSINDSEHSIKSLHRYDLAFDVRTHHIPTDKQKHLMLSQMRDAFITDVDVILEGLGTPNEHYHIEYDPK